MKLLQNFTETSNTWGKKEF
ncbi:hypothetical protein TNCT_256601, partial [Trichonephila clavata]